jgi:hypothetical protein
MAMKIGTSNPIFKVGSGDAYAIYKGDVKVYQAGLLDLVPGAAAAYSLRSLSNSYAGPVVTVRRSSDDAEQDFTAAEVADGTLAAFCGAGDGFVKTWFDQSGNARNASQATTTAQPQIVDNGVVVTEEGKPALQFDGVDDAIVSSYSIDLASSKKMTVVSAMTYSTATGTINCISLARALYADYQRGASIAIFPSSNYSEIVVGNGAAFYGQYRIAEPTTGQHLWSTVISAPSASVKSGFDGAVSAVPYAAGTGGKTVANWLESGSGSHALAIGARLLPSPGQFSNMRYQELVLYTDDMSEQLQLIEGQIAWSYSV